ncbi:MAG: hypothetical protein IT546_02190 [Caulobacteraceae bacterium]|nr:hypothetical protein [Caulobacteraceae bacterium]
MTLVPRVLLAAGLVAGLAGPAAAAPPAGHYECYFYGAYGLQNSSMTEISLLGGGRYEALGDRGRFQYDAGRGLLRMIGGGLAGRVAHAEESDGKPAIVFIRDENEVGGEPTIDISDTWCYFKPR